MLRFDEKIITDVFVGNSIEIFVPEQSLNKKLEFAYFRSLQKKIYLRSTSLLPGSQGCRDISRTK